MESFVFNTIKIYMKVGNMNYEWRSPIVAVFKFQNCVPECQFNLGKKCKRSLDLYS